MIKEELDKFTLGAVQAVLEEVGFDVRRMESCVIVEEGHELMARTRSLRYSPTCSGILELFKESMKQGYWDHGVGRIYLYQVGHHIMSEPTPGEGNYRPTVRYALHFELGTRPGFKSE